MSEYLTVLPFPDPARDETGCVRLSQRPAFGQGAQRLCTRRSRASPSLKPLNVVCPRIYKVARPMANRYPLLYSTFPSTRSFRSHDHYSFHRYYGPFRHPPQPGLFLAGFPARSSSRHGGLPMLTRFYFLDIFNAAPRRPDPVQMLLTSRASFVFAHPWRARRSHLTFRGLFDVHSYFNLCPRLIPRYGTFLRQRLRPLPLPAVTSPAASGWSNSFQDEKYPSHWSNAPFP